MSNDFDLNKSRWYNTMKVGLATKAIKRDAATVIDRSRILANFEYDATIGKDLADAETAATEALWALTVARREYEQKATPALVAAE